MSIPSRPTADLYGTPQSSQRDFHATRIVDPLAPFEMIRQKAVSPPNAGTQPRTLPVGRAVIVFSYLMSYDGHTHSRPHRHRQALERLMTLTLVYAQGP